MVEEVKKSTTVHLHQSITRYLVVSNPYHYLSTPLPYTKFKNTITLARYRRVKSMPENNPQTGTRGVYLRRASEYNRWCTLPTQAASMLPQLSCPYLATPVSTSSFSVHNFTQSSLRISLIITLLLTFIILFNSQIWMLTKLTCGGACGNGAMLVCVKAWKV